MEVVLSKVIRSAAFVIAVSPDELRLAVSGERKITVFSLSGFEKEYTIPVRHVSSMIFLKDNCSMLILNTTGDCYLWTGTTLERIGKWTDTQCARTPLFYAGQNTVFWSGCGAVWKYDIAEQQMTKVFSAEGEPFICRVGEGVIRLVCLKYNKSWQHMGIYKLDYNGSVLHKCTTKNRLQTNIFGIPCWNEDELIAISTVATIDGVHGFLYLVNSENGDVLVQKESSLILEGGDCFCGNGLIAQVLPVLDKSVTIYAADKLKLLYRLDKEVLDEKNDINPPTMVCFLKSGEILIGSWEKLFVYDVTIPENS